MTTIPAATIETLGNDGECGWEAVGSALVDYFRCPEALANFATPHPLRDLRGYFRFGRDAICFGRYAGSTLARSSTDLLHDAAADVRAHGAGLRLPFNLNEVVANLRWERYLAGGDSRARRVLHQAYYRVRPLLPVPIRKHLQRLQLRKWKEIGFPDWPVDMTVELIFAQSLKSLLERTTIKQIPFIWFWPDGAPGCAVMTHDVETVVGRDSSSALMDLNDKYQVKASFQIIPESRYEVPASFLQEIRHRGFEIGVHDLNHDGHLFRDWELFRTRVARINEYGRQYGARGFRAGALYHNFDWYSELDFDFDMSVASVGHLEAQGGGCCSVMPFFVGNILELPVTMTQDYSLFHILNDYSISLWQCQISQVREHNGLCSFIAHPDYLLESRARHTYESLLAYLSELRSEGRLWLTVPSAVNDWWRARNRMTLVRRDNQWVIEGPQCQKARVAYAALEGGRLTYHIESRQDVVLPPLSMERTCEAVHAQPSGPHLR